MDQALSPGSLFIFWARWLSRTACAPLRFFSHPREHGSTLLLCGLTGEATLLPGRGWELAFSDDGLADCKHDALDSVWVNSALDLVVGCNSAGRKFAKSQSTKKAVWLDVMAKKREAKYLSVEFATGPSTTALARQRLKIWRLGSPLDGQQVFWQLRDVQDTMGMP